MARPFDPTDRADITGTNILPPSETRPVIVTKTSTRERIIISTFISWSTALPTDQGEEGVVAVPTKTVTLSLPPQSTSTQASGASVVPMVTPPLSTPSTRAPTRNTALPPTVKAATTLPTSSPEYTPIVLQNKPPSKGGGGEDTAALPAAVIIGISIAAAAVVAAAFLAIFLRRRHNRNRRKSTVLELKRQIGKPVVVLPPSGGMGASALTFPKSASVSDASSEKHMFSPHESEAMLLSRSASAASTSAQQRWGPAAYPGSPAAHVLHVPISQSPAFTPDQGYYPGSIPTIVEPPPPPISAPHTRPTSSYYPTNAEDVEEPGGGGYAVSAYHDAGNPYTTMIKPVVQAGLSVPKSSHHSERVPSVRSGAAGDDAASYYSGWFMHESQGGGGGRGSAMPTIREGDHGGGVGAGDESLYGSIMAQCEAPLRPRGRRDGDDGAGEGGSSAWYSGPGASGLRNLTGYGGSR